MMQFVIRRINTLSIGVITLFVFTLIPGQSASLRAQADDDPPTTTPIKHFIFLMQENHSFDNYFGTYPGANGIPPGTCMPVDPVNDPDGECIEPFHIGDTDVQLDDPDHSLETNNIQYNEGKLDGFVYALNLRNQDGRLAMGYYDDRDLPYHWNVADEYVLFDNYFSSAGGGSYINHMYWVSGDPGKVERGENQQEVLSEVMTIFDRLQENGISWKLYIQNYEPELTYRTLHLYPGNRASQVIWAPVLYMDRFIDDPELNQHIVNLDEYYNDLVDGTLPAVAFIAPSGPSEHPPSSLKSGQRFIKTLIQSLMQSEYWESTAFMWSYDDWGGWYDHVPPPQVDEFGYGFRVPALLVSAYAKQGYIDSTQLDYTSSLKFIAENWGLEPLAARDAAANNLTNAFDFSKPPRQPRFLPFERGNDEPVKELRLSAIYFTYGSAIIFASTIIILAAALSGKTVTRFSKKEDEQMGEPS